MNIKTLIHNIFSVYNQKYHKVICILGFKMKFYCPSKYTKYRNKILNSYALKKKLSDKALKSLSDRIKNLETKGFKVQDLNKEIILSNKRIRIATDRYAWIAQEVFYDELYKLPKAILKKNIKYCVLDIGAIRCYTALYFADKKWCKRVDSFEIIPQTFNLARKNISLNKKNLQNKIHVYDFGLGSETKNIEAFYIPNRDGISTTDSEWLRHYAPNAVAKAKTLDCKVIQASSFLKELIDTQRLSNIILKIDAEGAEYEILQDLADNYPEFFNKVELMIGDTHCGFERFLRIVAPYNFKIIEAVPETNGCCSFLLVKNRKNL